MAGTVLKIRDETAAGAVLQELDLAFQARETTVQEIIAERVRMEVDLYERRVLESFDRALVAPTDAEALLNAPKAKRRKLDAEKQVALALDAFHANGFILLLGDAQAESLDQIVPLTGALQVSFVKLTPLVGG